MAVTRTVRTVAAIAGIAWAVAFFLPAATESIRGYEAFWLSFQSWGEPGHWDLESVPLVLAWLANLGMLAALAVVLGRPEKGLRLWSAAAGLGVLALGPPLVAAGDLRVGYYVWAVAILVVTLLALRGVRRR